MRAVLYRSMKSKTKNVCHMTGVTGPLRRVRLVSPSGSLGVRPTTRSRRPCVLLRPPHRAQPWLLSNLHHILELERAQTGPITSFRLSSQPTAPHAR